MIYPRQRSIHVSDLISHDDLTESIFLEIPSIHVSVLIFIHVYRMTHMKLLSRLAIFIFDEKFSILYTLPRRTTSAVGFTCAV